MTQKEIDEAEWLDPRNWHSVFYFAPGDSRVFVPKRESGVGITPNLARPIGFGILLGVLLILAWVIARAIKLL